MNMADKQEDYLKFLVKQVLDAQKGTEPQTKKETDLLDVFENKVFYVDEWNIPNVVESGNISATALVGNVLDNSLASVIGDVVPELIGYFFGGVKGLSKMENPYYRNALGNVETMYNNLFGKKDGGQGGASAGFVRPEDLQYGGISLKDALDGMNKYMKEVNEKQEYNSGVFATSLGTFAANVYYKMDELDNKYGGMKSAKPKKKTKVI